jgi:hypothetical protein
VLKSRLSTRDCNARVVPRSMLIALVEWASVTSKKLFNCRVRKLTRNNRQIDRSSIAFSISQKHQFFESEALLAATSPPDTRRTDIARNGWTSSAHPLTVEQLNIPIGFIELDLDILQYRPLCLMTADFFHHEQNGCLN